MWPCTRIVHRSALRERHTKHTEAALCTQQVMEWVLRQRALKLTGPQILTRTNLIATAQARPGPWSGMIVGPAGTRLRQSFLWDRVTLTDLHRAAGALLGAKGTSPSLDVANWWMCRGDRRAMKPGIAEASAASSCNCAMLTQAIINSCQVQLHCHEQRPKVTSAFFEGE